MTYPCKKAAEQNEPVNQKPATTNYRHMNAMIFAAGLGSRLRPVTDDKPKALVEIHGTTMLEIALKKIENAGITKTVVNIHHHHRQIVNFLSNYKTSGMEIIISDEKDRLLDTGGGLLKARSLFDANTPVLLYNVDIITSADLNLFIHFHEKETPLASLMVKNRPTSRYLLFDKNMILCGHENTKTGEKTLIRTASPTRPFGFQGVHIISPEIFNLIRERGVFPIMQLYLRLGSEHVIKGYETKNDIWFDIGTPEKLKKTREKILKLPEEERLNLTGRQYEVK
jgi:NDP-sugar pyrophosphorylase family protein